ncbi:DASH complex subunit ask1 [Mortierella claussenii]|nr:DASH complex subunit ask1 [Mortierella claussenii]
MASSSPSTSDVLDEIERLEQSITRTLQEIDESFSNCHSIVSTKILPQIDRYAESSREVWEHARLWLGFFEAASSPVAPVVGRRAQAAREARNRQQAAMATAASQQEAESTLPEYRNLPSLNSSQGDRDDSSTNRERIDEFNLSSSRLSPGFLNSPSLESMPSTPTPRRTNHNLSNYALGENILPQASTHWAGQNNQSQAPTTPSQHAQQNEGTALERGSTTPTITLKDRPMSFSTYGQPEPAPPKTPSGNRHQTGHSSTPLRGSQNGGFIELNVEEDHQDAITPPSTLHFSVPESKLATTPRSVVAKSLVDRIRMKDGLVIPQPIFVNDDDDEDAAVSERYTSITTVEESGLGGSKKRSREGDALEQEDSAADTQSRSWASLTDQQRNKERLLKSPRKMASVQDFFAPSQASSSKTTAAPHQEQQEEQGEERHQSPSRELLSQIRAQADPIEEDPLLAALATPPDTRKAIQDRKARDSLLPQTSTMPSYASLLSNGAGPFGSRPSTVRSNRNITNQPAAATTTAGTSTGRDGPLLTTAPIGTTTAPEIVNTSTTRSVIGTTFLESFNSAFAATSTRRQTMATAVVDPSRTRSQNQSNRNSMGSGSASLLTATPFSGRPSNSRLSLLSGARRPLYQTVPSPATQAAASAVVSAATTTSSIATPQAYGTSDKRTADAHELSTPVVSAASILSHGQGLGPPSTSSAAGSAERTIHTDSDYSSRGFLTPFRSRNPPPAPRLGYHSDTIMTQSSLGLNHDGFGGYDSKDWTRMTITSEHSGGTGMTTSRQSGIPPGTPGRGRTSSGLHSSSSQRPLDEEGYGDDESEEDDEDDEDATDNIMRSPCPPGKTLYSSITDLNSVARAAAAATAAAAASTSGRPSGSHGGGGGTSLFRRS